MDDIPESSTTLAWLWVIEALASFKEIDFSVIHDVIESAPELPDEEGRKAREVVAFRCLESLFGRMRVIGKNDAPARDSKITFDLSESSEDVLQRILYETSELDIRMGGPGMLKWDVSQFILHKRACMPKCELQQLKDAMLAVTHPYADLLKAKSGLAWMDKNISISDEDGDCNGVERSTKSADLGAQSKLVHEHQNDNPNTPLTEDGPSGAKTLVSKRKRLKFPSTIMTDHYNENHDVICEDDVPMNAKKQKQFSRIANDLEELDQAVLRGKKVLEESSGIVVSTAEAQEGCSMKDPIVSSEKRKDKKDFDEFHSPKNNRHGDNFFEDQLGKTGACVKALEACGGEAHQDAGVIEVLTEPNTSKFSPLGCSNHHQSNGTKSNFEQDFLTKKSNVGSNDHDQEQVGADQVEVDIDLNSIETEILVDSDGYHDEQIGVIEEKNKFLSSQCSINNDSSLPTDWTELNLCMKCNEVGQLLYCNNSTCPLAVHTQCLGIYTYYNEKGEFYCPFCSYSLAMSEHLDAKNKASLAKRELAAFIHSGLHGKDKNQSVDNGNANGKSIDNEHLEEVEVSLGKNDGKVGEQVNEVHNLKSFGKENFKHDHDTPSDIFNSRRREIDVALTRDAIGNVVGRTDGDGQMAQEHASVAGTDKPEDQEDIDSKGDHYVSNERVGDKSLLSVGAEEEAGLQLVVYQQKEVDYALNIAEDSSENDDESILHRYSIKFRKPNSHRTYSPSCQLRRKRVHWTSEEEEILKEGVEKFFTVHDRSIPWMKILEFGNAVFSKGRTAVDLKDKWRNMSKSQS